MKQYYWKKFGIGDNGYWKNEKMSHENLIMQLKIFEYWIKMRTSVDKSK